MASSVRSRLRLCVRNVMSPSEQYAFVDQVNWDDELEPITAILHSETRALETALLAFWRLEGPWLYIGDSEEEGT